MFKTKWVEPFHLQGHVVDAKWTTPLWPTYSYVEECNEVLLAVLHPSDMRYGILYYILYHINTKYISLRLTFP
jgi:hypothetical protein